MDYAHRIAFTGSRMKVVITVPYCLVPRWPPAKGNQIPPKATCGVIDGDVLTGVQVVEDYKFLSPSPISLPLYPRATTATELFGCCTWLQKV